MSKTNTFENDLLKLIFQAVSIANIADDATTSPATNLYVSLHVGDPGEAGNQETNEAMRFCYEQGKITKVDDSEDAEFVIIGSPDILRKVFNRELDPFVATTQGKVKTKGDFAKMSKWYPVTVRTFKLWEQAPVE